MDSLACALLSGTVALVLVGIPLAMAGWFRPYVVLPAALLGAWVLLPLFRVDSWPSRRGLDAAVIGVIAAAALLNAAHGGAWVKGGLDPSTYFSEATWLAQEGKIPMDSHPELFGGLPTVRAGGYPYAKNYPFSPLDGTRLQPYLFRGFPVLLAPAYWLGGTRLLAAVPGLLGGLALLLFYVLSRRLLRPWIAAVMTAALAFNPAQMYFSRNPWSEIAAQVFVLGAMWLLVAGRNRFRGWLAAGLTLGLACTVRIDAQMYLAPLLAYAALFVIRGVSGADEGARARSRFALAALAGFGVGFGLALMDGVLSGPAYLRDHWGPLRLAWLSTVLVVAGIIIVFGVRRFAPGVVAAVVARRGSIVRWAVVLTVVGMGFAL
ncbi:MAG: glycosyltransferase family 39 protein, partial [Actinomycetota bacterium]